MTDQKPNPHILIIDDEKVASRTMAMALGAVGYTTTEVESGKAGLDLALSMHPELIILDYNTPGPNGLAILRKLRKDTWGKQVPVIIASSIYDVDVINSIIELDVQDYVLKADVGLEEIIKLVGKYLPLPLDPLSVDSE